MPAVTVSAPGKCILFGEHAVVYNRPAIAVPVNQARVKVVVLADPSGKPDDVRVISDAVCIDCELSDLEAGHPLNLAIQGVKEELGVGALPAFRLKIQSTIPVAAGLGSGAAVSVAVIRAVALFLGHELPLDVVNRLAYRVEQSLHGTPSGIDNTVVTYGCPIYFKRDKPQPFERLQVPVPFTLVIGDTGIPSPTARSVAEVRRRWEERPDFFNKIFKNVGDIVDSAREMIEQGWLGELGQMMVANHLYLQTMGVSSPELDHLVEKAIFAGAIGAKLSGGGQGGNMIALVAPETAGTVADALMSAGATHTLITTVGTDAHV